MKNRDTIRLRQKIQLQPIRTYDYYPEDFPMETTQQLQDLVDRLSEEIPLPDIVNLHLPPVTYEGGLFIQSRPFNLYGSTDQQGHRTTFTDTVAIHAQNEPITYFYDLDFVGNGENIGLSSPSRLWAENCTFSNWENRRHGLRKCLGQCHRLPVFRQSGGLPLQQHRKLCFPHHV